MDTKCPIHGLNEPCEACEDMLTQGGMQGEKEKARRKDRA